MRVFRGRQGPRLCYARRVFAMLNSEFAKSWHIILRRPTQQHHKYRTEKRKLPKRDVKIFQLFSIDYKRSLSNRGYRVIQALPYPLLQIRGKQHNSGLLQWASNCMRRSYWTRILKSDMRSGLYCRLYSRGWTATLLPTWKSRSDPEQT